MIDGNLSGLSLEAMGFLLMLHKGINPENVHSSRVTIESAKEELIAKGIVKIKQQELS
jgi:hypothetical protein